MNYRIGQVAEKMSISAYTLRYYEKEGLLPFIKRDSNGIRMFEESDLEFLNVIHCLKKTGMSIKDIRMFIEWTTEGNASIQQRYDMFQERKKEVDKQIAELEVYREFIDFKCRYYQTALEAGTEDLHRNNDGKASEMPPGNIN